MQFNRLARTQLYALGLSDTAIAHRVEQGRLVIVERGVLAVAPALAHDEWGRWMGATLTAPGSLLSDTSAAAARGFWSSRRDFETITRAGHGGPRRTGGVLVFRSTTLDGDRELYRGIPITSVARTLLDLSTHTSDAALARAVRETVRLELTSVASLADYLGTARGRRGAARLGAVLERYAGLPVRRARSGAEVRALEILRARGRPMPRLNVRIAGEEADLSWAATRLIVEIDGGPFHLDAGEDARKSGRWEAAGWTVLRISSDCVYDNPEALLALAPSLPVPQGRL